MQAPGAAYLKFDFLILLSQFTIQPLDFGFQDESGARPCLLHRPEFLQIEKQEMK